MTLPPLPAADRDQLDRMAAIVRDELGDAALGGYLFGSATLDGLGPGSDLDLLVVAERPSSEAEQRRMVDGLLAISGRRGRHAEVTIVVASAVRPWRYPPRMDFQYGDWMRAEFEAGDLEPWPSAVNPDLAVLIRMVLQSGAPVFGPPAVEAFDPVPPGDVATAIIDSLEPLLTELEDDTGNVLLTLARMWTTLATGEIRSKHGAADWAVERLPPERRAALRDARDAYRRGVDEDWDGRGDEVRALADRLVGEIRRA